MRRHLVALLFLFVAIPATSQVDRSSDERAFIEQVLSAFTESWNRHDATAFSMLFTVDADFTNVAGVTASGRQAIEDFHAPRFASNFKDSHQTITRSKVRLIKPDVAAVDAWWEMTGARTASGEETGLRKGLLSFVMVKVSDRWQIAVMHNTNLPAQRLGTSPSDSQMMRQAP